MNKDDIKKRFNICKQERPAQKVVITSGEISEQTKTYLAKGGKINTIPQGVSSDFSDVGTPIPLLKDYKKAQQGNRNYMRRQSMLKSGKKGNKAVMVKPL